MILRGHQGFVLSAVWSPDGARILTASDDKTARVWLFDTELLRQALRRLTVHCLSSDQRQIHLLESEADATMAYRACELAHGRRPQPEPAPHRGRG